MPPVFEELYQHCVKHHDLKLYNATFYKVLVTDQDVSFSFQISKLLFSFLLPSLAFFDLWLFCFYSLLRLLQLMNVFLSQAKQTKPKVLSIAHLALYRFSCDIH